MGKGGRGSPKVLVVYGTESGNAKRGIEKIAKKWQAAGVEVDSIVEGNSMVSKFDTLATDYDVLIVSTSSYGEGDPPQNFNLFLLELYRKKDTNPLAGMQHAVLGYGASVYETFQNTPRLTDKLLGECGSRRLAARCELDEGMDDDVGTKLTKFEKDVLDAVQNLPKATDKPVCDWTVPESQILEKSESDLLMDAFEGAGSLPKGALIVGGLVALVGAYAYSQGMIEF